MSKGIACLAQLNCPKQEAPKQMRWPLLKAATVFFLLEVLTVSPGVEPMWHKLARGYRQFAADAPGQLPSAPCWLSFPGSRELSSGRWAWR